MNEALLKHLWVSEQKEDRMNIDSDCIYTISAYHKIIITKILNHLLLNDVFEILLGYIMNGNIC